MLNLDLGFVCSNPSTKILINDMLNLNWLLKTTKAIIMSSEFWIINGSFILEKLETVIYLSTL